jgi:hypothetical protein
MSARTVPVALVLSGVIGVTGACAGGSSPPATPASTDAAGSPAPVSGPTPAGSSSGSPGTAGPALVSSWKLIGVLPGGRSLSISYVAGGGCLAFERLDVQQTATSVRIAPLVHREQSAGQVCPPLLQLARTTVPLTQPLGNRRLIHPPVTAT